MHQSHTPDTVQMDYDQCSYIVNYHNNESYTQPDGPHFSRLPYPRLREVEQALMTKEREAKHEQTSSIGHRWYRWFG